MNARTKAKHNDKRRLHKKLRRAVKATSITHVGHGRSMRSGYGSGVKRKSFS